MLELVLAWQLSTEQTRDSSTVSRDVTQIEQQLAATWKNGDCDAWGAFLAPEWSVIHITGAVITKSEALQMCRTTPRPIETSTIDQLSVRPLGEAAVVTGRTTFKGGSANAETIVLRFTDVFARRDGRWLVVASHATRLTER